MLDDYIAEVPLRFYARLESRVRLRLRSTSGWQLGTTDSSEAWLTLIPHPQSPIPKGVQPCLALDGSDEEGVAYWRPFWGIYAKDLPRKGMAWQWVNGILGSIFPDVWDDSNVYMGWQWVPDFPAGDGASELAALTGEKADILADKMVDYLFFIAASLDELFGAQL